MSRPLRVLYLIRSWQIGGSHTIIRTLANRMPRDEFEIVTAVYDAPGGADARFAEVLAADGCTVSPVQIPWQSRGQWRAAQETIARLVAEHRVDLIHAHDTKSNVLVGLGRKRIPCACVGSPYGWWEGPWQFRAKFYHWVEKNLALPQFERVYTVSQDMKAKVLRGRTAADRIRVIHTGIDLSRFAASAARAETRASLGLPQDAVVVGTVSRLFREKGHTHLIAAAARLKERLPGLYLLIVGRGDESERLKAQAKACGLGDRIIFTGFYEDLGGALHAMDIFAQPSIDHEGFPTAVLEAESLGLPVIASDIGGTHETMRAGETGLLVPPGDVAALAEAVAALVEDTERRLAMGAAARRFVTGQFTLEGMIARIGAMYHEAVAEYRART